MKQFSFPNWLTYAVLFIVAILFVFLFSSTTSPLYEHYPFWFHGDSGIFQEMGVCLAQGGTPYVDLFDHKGPILWFIQALGIWINPYWGIMALQAISLFFAMLMWYKSTILLVDKQILSIIISISGLLFLLAFYERGNLCEEWSLPFISLPIYLYIKRWKHIENSELPIYSHYDAFIIGVCVGVIAMIRINNTAPIIGFVLWHFIRCIQNKEFKRLWIDIVLISGGMVAVFIACSAFYLIKAGWNGVYEMIYGTFIFNFLYINDMGNLTLSRYLKNYIPAVGCLLITSLCYLHNKSSRNISIPVVLSFVVTLISIGRFGFVHYMIIFVPILVISIGLIVLTKTNWSYIALGIVMIHSLYLGYDAVDHLLFRLRGKQANTELNDGFHRFVTSISSEERESIYNAGLNHMGAGLFADENIYQCNRIIYGGHTELSPHLQEYAKTHGIKDLQPIWVLTQSPRPEATDEYLANHYTLFDSIPGGEFDPIWCWKLFISQ